MQPDPDHDVHCSLFSQKSFRKIRPYSILEILQACSNIFSANHFQSLILDILQRTYTCTRLKEVLYFKLPAYSPEECNYKSVTSFFWQRQYVYIHHIYIYIRRTLTLTSIVQSVLLGQTPSAQPSSVLSIWWTIVYACMGCRWPE